MKKETIEYFEKMRDVVVRHDNDGSEQPYSIGALNAYRCYEDSDINHSTVDGGFVLECEAAPKTEFAEDFLKTLKEAGAEEVIFTNDSGLINFLHRMNALGCTIDQTCTVQKKIFNLDEQTDYGIRLKI